MEHDSTLRLAPSFMDGAMMAAAAVPDSVLIYVGAACITEHFRNTYLVADWGQDLVLDGPRTRLALTFSDLTAGVLGTTEAIEKTARRVLAVRRPSCFFLAELSRVTLAGEDLVGVAMDLRERTGVPSVALSSRFLTRDHDAAFRAAIEGLADSLPDAAFEGGPIPGTAAVIGYLYERHEADQRANTACLEGLLRGVGLDPLPTWLSHAPVPDLARAARASVLAALPSGREAARRIQARSGATIVDVELPVGVAGTEDFLNRLAEAAGSAARPETVVVAGLHEAWPLLERAVLTRLAGRRVALAALPEWLPGLARTMAQDLGMGVAVRVRRGRAADPSDPDSPASQDPDRDHDPSVLTWNRHLSRALREGGLDVVVGSSWERNAVQGDAAQVPYLEFGYPCFSWHDLTGRPSLGVAGVLTWAERLAGAIR